MGCGGSSGAQDPNDEKIDWNNDAEIDEEFNEDANQVKKKFNKKTGAAEDRGDADDREFDFFEGADAGSGEQFMAVRPYEGAIMEPTNHNEPSDDLPDISYELEYVYGYRAEDSRMNVYYSSEGKIVYFTAALGVILCQKSNMQTFFGGGETDNTSKKVARTEKSHTNDITAIGISVCRKLAATGQNGSKPVAFVWDTSSGEKKARFQCKKGGREITAISICPAAKYVAMTDNSNDHNLYVFEIDSQKCYKNEKTGGYRVYHIQWSQKPGESVIGLAGVKHFALWDLDASKFKASKGLYMGNGKPTTHCCIAFDGEGNAYTGGANSHIYCWKGRELNKNYDVHGKGFVCAIRYLDGKVYSGAKDGRVVISNPESGEAERTIETGCLVRSVDMADGTILAGLRDGSIIEIESSDAINYVMRSHSTGETWGLAIADDSNFVTSGDDNKTMAWNIDDRKWTGFADLCGENKNPKRGGASSMTSFAPSKCGRAVAINKAGNGDIAIGHNDGRITIRGGIGSLDAVKKTIEDSEEWIECMAYSPDGSKLAVGSHDDNIYIYDSSSYDLLGKCDKHNSFIVSVDWSEDGSFIRSVCGAHELLFFDGNSYEQDPSGASNTVETVWATNSAKYGWLVSGIFPAATDGTHINHVDFSPCGGYIVTADDYGLVNLWRNPARKGAKPRSLRGHSEHVVRTYFAKGGDYIISVGGYDKTIMQWKKK